MDLTNCAHELCNSTDTILNPEQVEQIILCGVEKGLFEVASVNKEDGSFNYQMTKEYKEYLRKRDEVE